LTLGIGEGAAKIEAINGSGHRSGERAHQCEIRAQNWILIETRGTSMIAHINGGAIIDHVAPRDRRLAAVEK
jgi:hypothetical protein